MRVDSTIRFVDTDADRNARATEKECGCCGRIVHQVNDDIVTPAAYLTYRADASQTTFLVQHDIVDKMADCMSCRDVVWAQQDIDLR